MVLFNPLLGRGKFNSFTKSMSPKVNVIVQREFELSSFEAAVLHVRRYVTRTLRVFYVEIIWHVQNIEHFSGIQLKKYSNLS